MDLHDGRYDTILPSSSVADRMIDAYGYAGARDAHDGQTNQGQEHQRRQQASSHLVTPE